MKKIFLIASLIGFTAFSSANENNATLSNINEDDSCNCSSWANDQAWAEIDAFGGSRSDFAGAYLYYLDVCDSSGCPSGVVILGDK